MGGFYGHMPHLYDNRELTFNDVKNVLTQASEGKLIGTEKSDGFAIYLGFVDGSPRAARSASDIKTGGMDYEALLAREFKGGPEVRDVFIKAFESYEKATRSLTDDEINKIFGNQGELFYLADLISVQKGNVVNYSKNIITIHHTGYSKYDSETGEIEKVSAPENAKYLDRVIDKFEDLLTDDDFKIERTALLQLGDLSDGKDRDIALAKMQKAGFSGGMTIDQYLENQISPLVEAQLTNFPEEIQQGILDRILGRSGANLTQIAKGMPKEQKKYLSDFVRANEKKLLNDAIYPLEEAIHEFAVEALKGLHSAYILDNEAATEKLKNQVELAIKTVQAYQGEGWEEAHDILIKQLQKLKHHDKISTAVEGFVFQYGDQTYKFTGNFAPINQILGLFRYGRGKTVPPISADLQEQENEEEIDQQRVIALVPGAYKPPHVGHFEMVKHYSSEVGPNGVVYVIISPLSRGGGDQADVDFQASYKIWQIYIQSAGLSNVIIYDKPSATNSPVRTAFEFIENPNFAKPGDHIILGCSDKLDKKGVSDCQRFKNAEYVQNYAAPGVKILDFYEYEYQTVPGEALSATDFRKALAAGDESEISGYIPEEVSDRIGAILDILGYKTMKEEKKTNLSLLSSLVEEAIKEADSEKQRDWACAQAGDSRKSFKGKKSLTPKEAEEVCKSKVEEEQIEEISAMGAGAAGTPGSVEGYSGPFTSFTQKEKKKDNQELVEQIMNYLISKGNSEENIDMHYSRDEFAAEMLLREYIRKIIGVVRENKHNQVAEDKNELRNIIKNIVLAEAAEISDEVPHLSTGINVLEDLLKKIIPIIEDDFKILTTDPDQRLSFRAHIIKGIQNAIAPSMTVANIQEQIGVDVGGGEEAAPAPDLGDEAFIDVAGQPEPDEKEEFGIPGEEETGRNMALTTFKKIEKNILDAYELLANNEDRETFYDYLLTNMKLYFDKFEDEMAVSLEEPTTPEYEEQVGQEQPAPEAPMPPEAAPQPPEQQL